MITTFSANNPGWKISEIISQRPQVIRDCAVTVKLRKPRLKCRVVIRTVFNMETLIGNAAWKSEISLSQVHDFQVNVNGVHTKDNRTLTEVINGSCGYALLVIDRQACLHENKRSLQAHKMVCL